MTPSEYAVALETPRVCTWPGCKFTGLGRDFPQTTAYGKPYIRVWCKACLKRYYQIKARQRKLTGPEA